MSLRNFARLFMQEIAKTPGTHVGDLRLEVARRQPESTAASLEEVAKFSGFKSAEVLRRVLRKHCRNYGPIMVQLFFLSVLKRPLGATRVA
jgi:transcriptional regulator GlxA family with amidase domain